MSDHDADERALWRAFLLEPTKDTAYLWARAAARLRSELPDPPVADRRLVELAPAFNRLAGGAAERLARLLSPRVAPLKGSQIGATVRLVDLADVDPDVLSTEQGAGALSMFAAAVGLRMFGMHRLAWEAWLLRARRVYPQQHQAVVGRGVGDAFRSALERLAAGGEALPGRVRPADARASEETACGVCGEGHPLALGGCPSLA